MIYISCRLQLGEPQLPPLRPGHYHIDLASTEHGDYHDGLWEGVGCVEWVLMQEDISVRFFLKGLGGVQNGREHMGAYAFAGETFLSAKGVWVMADLSRQLSVGLTSNSGSHADLHGFLHSSTHDRTEATHTLLDPHGQMPPAQQASVREIQYTLEKLQHQLSADAHASRLSELRSKQRLVESLSQPPPPAGQLFAVRSWPDQVGSSPERIPRPIALNEILHGLHRGATSSPATRSPTPPRRNSSPRALNFTGVMPTPAGAVHPVTAKGPGGGGGGTSLQQRPTTQPPADTHSTHTHTSTGSPAITQLRGARSPGSPAIKPRASRPSSSPSSPGALAVKARGRARPAAAFHRHSGGGGAGGGEAVGATTTPKTGTSPLRTPRRVGFGAPGPEVEAGEAEEPGGPMGLFPGRKSLRPAQVNRARFSTFVLPQPPAVADPASPPADVTRGPAPASVVADGGHAAPALPFSLGLASPPSSCRPSFMNQNPMAGATCPQGGPHQHRRLQGVAEAQAAEAEAAAAVAAAPVAPPGRDATAAARGVSSPPPSVSAPRSLSTPVSYSTPQPSPPVAAAAVAQAPAAPWAASGGGPGTSRLFGNPSLQSRSSSWQHRQLHLQSQPQLPFRTQALLPMNMPIMGRARASPPLAHAVPARPHVPRVLSHVQPNTNPQPQQPYQMGAADRSVITESLLDHAAAAQRLQTQLLEDAIAANGSGAIVTDGDGGGDIGSLASPARSGAGLASSDAGGAPSLYDIDGLGPGSSVAGTAARVSSPPRRFPDTAWPEHGAAAAFGSSVRMVESLMRGAGVALAATAATSSPEVRTWAAPGPPATSRLSSAARGDVGVASTSSPLRPGVQAAAGISTRKGSPADGRATAATAASSSSGSPPRTAQGLQALLASLQQKFELRRERRRAARALEGWRLAAGPGSGAAEAGDVASATSTRPGRYAASSDGTPTATTMEVVSELGPPLRRHWTSYTYDTVKTQWREEVGLKTSSELTAASGNAAAAAGGGAKGSPPYSVVSSWSPRPLLLEEAGPARAPPQRTPPRDAKTWRRQQLRRRRLYSGYSRRTSGGNRHPGSTSVIPTATGMGMEGVVALVRRGGGASGGGGKVVQPSSQPPLQPRGGGAVTSASARAISTTGRAAAAVPASSAAGAAAAEAQQMVVSSPASSKAMFRDLHDMVGEMERLLIAMNDDVVGAAAAAAGISATATSVAAAAGTAKTDTPGRAGATSGTAGATRTRATATAPSPAHQDPPLRHPVHPVHPQSPGLRGSSPARPQHLPNSNEGSGADKNAHNSHDGHDNGAPLPAARQPPPPSPHRRPAAAATAVSVPASASRTHAYTASAADAMSDQLQEMRHSIRRIEQEMWGAAAATQSLARGAAAAAAAAAEPMTSRQLQPLHPHPTWQSATVQPPAASTSRAAAAGATARPPAAAATATAAAADDFGNGHPPLGKAHSSVSSSSRTTSSTRHTTFSLREAFLQPHGSGADDGGSAGTAASSASDSGSAAASRRAGRASLNGRSVDGTGGGGGGASGGTHTAHTFTHAPATMARPVVPSGLPPSPSPSLGGFGGLATATLQPYVPPPSAPSGGGGGGAFPASGGGTSPPASPGVTRHVDALEAQLLEELGELEDALQKLKGNTGRTVMGRVRIYHQRLRRAHRHYWRKGRESGASEPAVLGCLRGQRPPLPSDQWVMRTAPVLTPGVTTSTSDTYFRLKIIVPHNTGTMRQRTGTHGKFALVDSILGPETRSEPLDEQEQEAVIREFEALSLQDHTRWRIVFGGGALVAGLFFLYAAWRQHVEPFGVRYTGELRSAIRADVATSVLLLQALSLVLSAGSLLTSKLPPAGHRAADGGLPYTTRHRAVMRVGVAGAAVGAVCWTGVLIRMVHLHGRKHGSHWELSWLPLGPLIACLLCGHVASMLTDTEQEAQEEQGQRVTGNESTKKSNPGIYVAHQHLPTCKKNLLHVGRCCRPQKVLPTSSRGWRSSGFTATGTASRSCEHRLGSMQFHGAGSTDSNLLPSTRGSFQLVRGPTQSAHLLATKLCMCPRVSAQLKAQVVATAPASGRWTVAHMATAWQRFSYHHWNP
ncbi:hypothetical protein VOLCADRAFT_107034 [Volvox carteri f. nagariensis]|uniref:Uncharacterized protein n=1 Tax=Volvox carteri f. nagariensis TaxID=3068 RepID=D8UBF4_VOLCA|nr:uncharacterized protein VOLCADRAFT_107034 [Volvox carteri f. nagariensis]EFJ42938.1 hypothetical protein VOLCADRAFT_107034 [Volvox carteri f. nagariensis]|eukprot:XP_002955978.1 hypothetical protein VOLCADRAFT_107034 [Volvox carteri f. nagariensis]